MNVAIRKKMSTKKPQVTMIPSNDSKVLNVLYESIPLTIRDDDRSIDYFIDQID